jgi:DNA-binding HxlR family transcriptional regulator
MADDNSDPVSAYADGTSTREALDRMANRWTILITVVLEDGPARFNELKNRLGITSQVLTRVLRDLERDGLVKREVFMEVPARVEYSLTELGGTMCSPVLAVREWAEDVAAKINKAREAFDAHS